MKKFVSNISKIFALGAVASSTPLFMNMTSCSSADAIEFANYESYMSDSLMEDLQDHYNIHFPNYTVAEMIPAKFERFYDCAVPCGYELMALLRNGWLEKIDWAKFDVKDLDGNKITTAAQARKLYVDETYYNGIEVMNNQFETYIKEPGHEDMLKYLDPDGKFNILNYGVPYFAQSYMFAYTGTEIKFYHHNDDGSVIEVADPTWADIFFTISPANPYLEDRFKQKKIGMVDDARSFHDISRIVESSEESEQSGTTLDPIPNANIDRVKQTMSHITNKFEGKQGSFVLNSDSAIVSRGLADRNGDQTAVLSWSGDTIYAAQGAEEFDAFTWENFHIQKPYDKSFDEIEFVVINNKNDKNPTKLNNIYSVVKQICLDGCDQDDEHICEKTDDRYKYWAMDNWNTVMYTPMLKSIYSVVVDATSDYWQEQMEECGYSEDTVKKLFIPILDGQIPSGCNHIYGKTLTPLQNSNNHWAWLEQRGKL